MSEEEKELYKVKPGETINNEWMKAHPEYTFVRGMSWDVENEREVYADIINPYGRLGFFRKPGIEKP